MKLFINNYEIELSDKTNVARTLQVNDLISLNSRQTNFTATFKIPKTKNNIFAFKNLGIVGNVSNVPYEKNDVYLFSDDGELLLYKGWLLVRDSDEDNYNCNIYDGNIDFYKAIEEYKLSNLPLDEINHIKDLTNVIDSFDGSTVYKYIIADYNGKTLYNDNLNIDYLIPSVPVSYLWNKIFDFFGYTFSGAIFDTFKFQNLYMTFPKGVGALGETEEVFFSDDTEDGVYQFFSAGGFNHKVIYFNSFTSANNSVTTFYDNLGTGNNLFIQFLENGNYKIDISFSLINVGTYKANLHMLLNQPFGNYVPYSSLPINNSNKILENFGNGSYSLTLYRSFNANDYISFLFKEINNYFIPSFFNINDFTITITKLENELIDFNQAFLDFSVKDFLNEVLYQFSLTPYKDKYTNHYEFLTLNEVLQTTEIYDWSDKFNKKLKESYVYGNYAQKNIFARKYNDIENDHANGNIFIDNKNLQETKTVIQSKIYAPEKDKVKLLGLDTNVYKLWDKEPKEDGTINYKQLDKRFYFLSYEDTIFPSAVTLTSEGFGVSQTVTSIPIEKYSGISYNDVCNNDYLIINNVLNQSKIIDAEIFLNENDIVNIDFKKLVYLKQEASYFLINKISNFSKKGLTKCELIKVDYYPPSIVATFDILIVAYTSYGGGCVYFYAPFPVIQGELFISTDGGSTFVYEDDINTAPNLYNQCGYSFATGTKLVLRDENGVQISNIYTV